MRTALVSLLSFGLAWVIPQLPGHNSQSTASAAMKADSVQDYLSLTADQQKQLDELGARLRIRAQSSQQQLESKQKALRMQLAADNADPLAAGRALLELEVAKHRSERTAEESQTEALAVLTAEQRQKLTVLEQAAKLHSITRQAMGIFLIPPPEAFLSGTGPLGMFPAKKRSGRPSIPSAT